MDKGFKISIEEMQFYIGELYIKVRLLERENERLRRTLEKMKEEDK